MRGKAAKSSSRASLHRYRLYLDAGAKRLNIERLQTRNN